MENDNSKKIELTQNKFVIVDADDWEWLNKVKWSYSKNMGAIRSIERRRHKQTQIMARVIMSPTLEMPAEIQVNNIDGDKLNLRRCNLRLMTVSQRQAKTKKQNRPLTSKYKGVYYDRAHNKWRAQIKPTGMKRVNLGRFSSEEEAALAYDEAAKEYFGEFARLNIEKSE